MRFLATMPASVASISYSSAAVHCGGLLRGNRGNSHSHGNTFVPLGSSASFHPQGLQIPIVASSKRRGNGGGVRSSLSTGVVQQDEQNVAQKKKQEHEKSIDLNQWMQEQGMPECKVALADHQPWEDRKGRPIHQIVASQDLEVWA